MARAAVFRGKSSFQRVAKGGSQSFLCGILIEMQFNRLLKRLIHLALLGERSFQRLYAAFWW
jgi:hypothetical protein